MKDSPQLPPEYVRGAGTYRTSADPRQTVHDSDTQSLVTITWYWRYFDARQAADILARSGVSSDEVRIVGTDLHVVEDSAAPDSARAAAGHTVTGLAGAVFGASQVAVIAWPAITTSSWLATTATAGAVLGMAARRRLRSRPSRHDGQQLTVGRYELRVRADRAAAAYRELRDAQTLQGHAWAVAPMTHLDEDTAVLPVVPPAARTFRTHR